MDQPQWTDVQTEAIRRFANFLATPDARVFILRGAAGAV